MQTAGVNNFCSCQRESWFKAFSLAQIYTLGTVEMGSCRRPLFALKELSHYGALLFQKSPTGSNRVVEPGQLGQATWRIRTMPGVLTKGADAWDGRLEGVSQAVGCCPSNSLVMRLSRETTTAQRKRRDIPMSSPRSFEASSLPRVDYASCDRTPDVPSEAAQAARRICERASVRRTPTPPLLVHAPHGHSPVNHHVLGRGRWRNTAAWVWGCIPCFLGTVCAARAGLRCFPRNAVTKRSDDPAAGDNFSAGPPRPECGRLLLTGCAAAGDS